MTDLAHIEITSGVAARNGEGFCRVTAVDSDGQSIEGQLPPDEVRRMALGWLEAADAAISDAAVFRLLKERVGVPDDLAVVFVADLRNFRADMR